MKEKYFLIFSLLIFSCQRKSPFMESLRLVSLSDPKTFNLIVSDETSSTDVVGVLFESLVEMDPLTLDFIPSLAERWDVSPDKREWTFYIRDSAKWSDGKPVSSEDVIFTLSAIFDPRVPNSYRDILTVEGKPITAVSLDEKTVRFYLPSPFAPFMSSVGGIPILPSHILRESLEKGVFSSTWNISEKPENIIASGPYVMVKYVPSQFVIYRRNPCYWKKDERGNPLPYIFHRTLFIIPSLDTQFLRFERGDIDIFYPRAEDVSNLENRKEKNFELKDLGPAPGITFLAFNRNPRYHKKGGKVSPKFKWFRDINFLRAIAHSLDKNTMIKNVLFGYGVPASAFISPANIKYHNAELKDYEYDLKISRNYLIKGGYIDRNNDGYVEDSEGNTVEFNLFTNSGNTVREKICSIIIDDLKKIGIKVNFKPIDFNELVERLVSNFEWDAVVLGFTGTVEPHNGANIWKSSGKLHIWNPGQDHPSEDWEREIDELVEKGAREMDERKRKEIYFRIQEILHRELPLIPLVWQNLHVAYLKRVRNFYPSPWGWRKPELMKLEQ